MAAANGDENVEEFENFEEGCGTVMFVDCCGGALRGAFAASDVVCYDAADTKNNVQDGECLVK